MLDVTVRHAGWVLTVGGDSPGNLTIEQAKRLVELLEVAIGALEKVEELKEKDNEQLPRI